MSEVAAILLADEHDERSAVDARRRERPDCRSEPCRGVQDRERRLAASDGVAARQRHERRLVEPEHELEVGGQVGEERDLGRAGVREELRQTPLPEDVEDRVSYLPFAFAHRPTLTQMILLVDTRQISLFAGADAGGNRNEAATDFAGVASSEQG